MKEKNMNIRKKALLLLAAGGVTLMLTGCNRQAIDLNKSFNVAVEPNGNNISVVAIDSYNDYEGTQVQFYTATGLVVLSSTHQLELIYTDSEKNLKSYIKNLSNDDDVIYYHDDEMGTSIDFEKGWNKRLADFKYSFNKALILRDDDTVSILDIISWRDYEKDDKIQLTLKDGTTILTEIDKVKIVDDRNALPGALESYAASLVGSKENINNNSGKQYTKTK